MVNETRSTCRSFASFYFEQYTQMTCSYADNWSVKEHHVLYNATQQIPKYVFVVNIR